MATKQQKRALSPRQKQVRDYTRKGKSPSEIAKILGITSNAVSMSVKKLRERGELEPTNGSGPATSADGGRKQGGRRSQKKDTVAVGEAAWETVPSLSKAVEEIDARLEAINTERGTIHARREEIHQEDSSLAERDGSLAKEHDGLLKLHKSIEAATPVTA